MESQVLHSLHLLLGSELCENCGPHRIHKLRQRSIPRRRKSIHVISAIRLLTRVMAGGDIEGRSTAHLRGALVDPERTGRLIWPEQSWLLRCLRGGWESGWDLSIYLSYPVRRLYDTIKQLVCAKTCIFSPVYGFTC